MGSISRAGRIGTRTNARPGGPTRAGDEKGRGAGGRLDHVQLRRDAGVAFGSNLILTWYVAPRITWG